MYLSKAVTVTCVFVLCTLIKLLNVMKFNVTLAKDVCMDITSDQKFYNNICIVI